MSLYKELLSGRTKLSLIGLGYVGMPLAVELSKQVSVVGYDFNESKIQQYLQGIDPTREVGNEGVLECRVEFTSDPLKLEEASFHIIAVPTPVNLDKTPDLSPIESASRTLGRHLHPGSIIVYESTVYPGATEDICVPILEKESGLKHGVDFKVGYSPERINPGDRIHTLSNITKIVSGCDETALEQIKLVYDLAIRAGTFPVSTIRTAEAIKVVENSQRDVNIAFMNELAMVFDKMEIDTDEVIAGMNTKWNALGFKPGLVGGHCIGVDPYYFTYEAEKLGYHSQIILSGRKVNDGMGEYIADTSVKKMVQEGIAPKRAKTVILGLTFKENCPDCRNSKVGDVIECLRGYGIEPIVIDPWATNKDAEAEYQISLSSWNEAQGADCVIVAVAHKEFKEKGLAGITSLFSEGIKSEKILIDVKSMFDRKELEQSGFSYWRL